jgi:hypothetical protein
MSNPPSEHTKIGRRELFDRIWSKPMTTNAVELGTKASTLAALARRLELPLPRVGHWMKKEVGKEPPTPTYPASPVLDGEEYLIAPASRRTASPPSPKKIKNASAPEQPELQRSSKSAPIEAAPEAPADVAVHEHPQVASTRSAIQRKNTTDRAFVGGRGKFRLLVTPAAGDRACSIMDQLLAALDGRGWSIEDAETGYVLLVDGESIPFRIEEKLDRIPHVPTAAEVRAKAEYDRKCMLADRGIGYRPWGPPSVPDFDYLPNGDLSLQFDHNYAANGQRRTFSDGKRQRLENLIPSIIDASEAWAVSIRARREEQARWEREWAEKDEQRRARERQIRVESYRVVFLQRQLERAREVDGLTALIARWEHGDTAEPVFARFLEFARLYRSRIEAALEPGAVAKRITDLKLMNDDVHIYDLTKID